IGQALEGEKGNADRQDDPRVWQGEREAGIEISDDEICVFENAEDADVENNGCGEDQLPVFHSALQEKAGTIVDQYRSEKQRDILQLAESVKDDAGRGKEQILDFERRTQPGEDKHCRQKHK
ncbi:MAG: hypothetical protein IK118_02495, partial [Clostridia bacterium]|nr:hypothetical protein [Clostridia bacterium]